MIDGRYELEAVIGRGGMGTVWRAWDRILNADVALKLSTHADGSPWSQRLLREARACAVLHHPAVVRILAYGVSGTHAYIAMELLEGDSLDQILDAGPIAAEQAVQLTLPIVEALAVAHHAGVVHRDIKPSNIVISEQPDGTLQPKLLDFGIAKSQNAGLPLKLTVTGAVLGTPHFMSPEQARGRGDVDHSTDVWGICAVLYEAITGACAFDGENYNAVISAVLLQEPAPMSVICDVDPELETIVMRGLEKDRARRWSSADDLALALSAWLRARGHCCDISGRILRGTQRWGPPTTPDPPIELPPDPEPPRPRASDASLPAIATSGARGTLRPVVPASPLESKVWAVGVLAAAILMVLGSYHAGSANTSSARVAYTWTTALAVHAASISSVAPLLVDVEPPPEIEAPPEETAVTAIAPPVTTPPPARVAPVLTAPPRDFSHPPLPLQPSF